MGDITPTNERIQLLDTLRGVGVLGILLMNITAFGLLSPAYSFAGFDVSVDGGANLWAWMLVELFGEGSMRGMFSLLFGAGVVLFTTGDNAKSAATHYRRMFFLLLFGLFDAYVLLWFGDILVCYALCGAMLYPLRHWRPRSLIIVAIVVGTLSSLSYVFLHFALDYAHQAAIELVNATDPEALDPALKAAADGWRSFQADMVPASEILAEEQHARAGSYISAFAWNVSQTNDMLLFVMPFFILWDALLMMLLGMALFKLDVLRGGLSAPAAIRMALLGLGLGLAMNSWEVYRAVAADLSLLSVFAQVNGSYHLGRGAMTLGYVGLLAWLLQSGLWSGLLSRLAAVGRMALSNYLLHSVLAMLIFTGAGLGLVGQLSRAQLYPVVLAIWLLQLWLSPWWLARYRFGPLEYLWRTLTYGRVPGR